MPVWVLIAESIPVPSMTFYEIIRVEIQRDATHLIGDSHAGMGSGKKFVVTGILKGLGRIAGGFNHRRHCAHTMSPERTTLILFIQRRVRSNPAELDSLQYPLMV